MSRSVFVCLCTVMALVTPISAALFHPTPALADSGTLRMATSLHDSPDPAAPVIALLPEGTAVAIDGPPVDGFYPVTTGDLSGWMRGETLSLEKDTPESVAAEDIAADPLVNTTDETVPVEASAELDPVTDPAMATPLDPATDLAADTSAAPGESPPVAEPTSEDEAVPVVEPVPAEELPPASESAPVDAPAPDGAVLVPSALELDSTATPIPIAADGESPSPNAASDAPAVAAEPTLDPNVTPIPAPEVAAVGSASVTVDAPIRTGPGPNFELIVTAPTGGAVLQTGHVIDGYVTVQYEGVTGWVAIEHLGAPSSFVEEAPPVETAPAETPLVDASPAETPPTEAASGETPLAETPPSETPTAETSPVETAPVESAPVDAVPVDAAPVAAP